MELPSDPVIRELLPEFVDDWINQLETQTDQLIEDRNDKDIYRMGHTIKGSCFQFGLNDIANQGIRLMGLANEKNFADARNVMNDIHKSFVDVRNFLASDS